MVLKIIVDDYGLTGIPDTVRRSATGESVFGDTWVTVGSGLGVPTDFQTKKEPDHIQPLAMDGRFLAIGSKDRATHIAVEHHDAIFGWLRHTSDDLTTSGKSWTNCDMEGHMRKALKTLGLVATGAVYLGLSWVAINLQSLSHPSALEKGTWLLGYMFIVQVPIIFLDFGNRFLIKLLVQFLAFLLGIAGYGLQLDPGISLIHLVLLLGLALSIFGWVRLVPKGLTRQ